MDLKEEIERFEVSLKKNDPDFLELLQPGLSSAEIGSLLGEAEIELHEDVEVLYQWRNGISGWDYFEKFYMEFTFLPLSESMKYYVRGLEQMNKYGSNSNIWPGESSYSLPVLPFLQIDADTLGLDSQGNVVCVTKYLETEKEFNSLGHLFRCLSSFYDEGALPVDEYSPEVWSALDGIRERHRKNV